MDCPRVCATERNHSGVLTIKRAKKQPAPLGAGCAKAQLELANRYRFILYSNPIDRGGWKPWYPLSPSE